MTAPLAYREPNEDEGALIIYFEDEAHAAAYAENECLNVSDLVRAPEFDKYAHKGGPDPQDFLNEGWWLGCTNCGEQVSYDAAEDWNADIEDGSSDKAPMTVLVEGNNLFCNQGCRDEYHAERELWAKNEADALRATLEKFPGVEVTRVYSAHTSHPHVIFQLPGVSGLEGELGWTVGSEKLTMHPDAQKHYRAYKEQQVNP